MIKILDLFCGAGGCSAGYSMALLDLGIAHEITGVDIKHQPNYPFRFIQADAITWMDGNTEKFDFCHASPPCQEYSITRSLHRNSHPDLVEPCRARLLKSGIPWVMENVLGAPFENYYIILDGPMFGLKVIRKRLFESNLLLMQPAKGLKRGFTHPFNSKDRIEGRQYNYFSVCGHSKGTHTQWKNAMGIHWMTKPELAQAIPPAYTRWIGSTIFPNLFK